jgi:hypothetical protein
LFITYPTTLSRYIRQRPVRPDSRLLNADKIQLESKTQYSSQTRVFVITH